MIPYLALLCLLILANQIAIGDSTSKCTSSQVLSGGKCKDRCPQNQVWNGKICHVKCKADQKWNGKKCEARCLANKCWKNSKCQTCPAKPTTTKAPTIPPCPKNQCRLDKKCQMCPTTPRKTTKRPTSTMMPFCPIGKCWSGKVCNTASCPKITTFSPPSK